MWNKIYLIALAVAVIVITFLDVYSYNWLKSIGSPANAVQNYNYFSDLAWMFLWLSSIALLVLANALYWRVQQSWALWTTFLYFAFFIIVQTFVLEDMFTSFRQQNSPAQGGFNALPFLGVILCIVAAIIVFFDQFLVSRLHKKMFGVTPEQIEPPVEGEVE